MLSRAVEAPLVVPFVTGSVLLVFKGRFLDDGVDFNLAAGGGGVVTGLTAGLTGSVLGLFVNTVDFVIGAFGRLVVVVVTEFVFLVA